MLRRQLWSILFVTCSLSRIYSRTNRFLTYYKCDISFYNTVFVIADFVWKIKLALIGQKEK